MKYRIVYNGFSWELQRWGVINYDGILDHDWTTIRYFNSEKEASEHLDELTKYSN